MRLFASYDFARCFYVNGFHVLLLQGVKPAHGEVQLIEDTHQAGSVSLLLQLAPVSEPDPLPDRYYLVKAVLPKGPMRTTINVVHCSGLDRIPVEVLGCRARSCCPGVTGRSQSFCLDEAFADALRQLPILERADRSAPVPLVDVVAIGALYGGFAGFSHFFVRLEERS